MYITLSKNSVGNFYFGSYSDCVWITEPNSVPSNNKKVTPLFDYVKLVNGNFFSVLAKFPINSYIENKKINSKRDLR